MNIDWKKLLSQIDVRRLAFAAGAIVLFGIILLAFTYVLPVLIFAAAVGIIGFIIYLVYRFLGGR
jgi:hypothetical protein